VPVSCGACRGLFYPLSRLVRCRCASCKLHEDGLGRSVYQDPIEFERHGGMGARPAAAGAGARLACLRAAE
jgi:hypothetical protein